MNPLKKPLPFLALAIFASLVFIAIACNKGATPTNSSINSNNIPPDAIVNASIQGRVVDQNGEPVQGAAVTSGTVSTTTDVNGVFKFTNISMSTRFGFVKAVKTGYFAGSRSIITNGGASNYVNIQLIPRSETGSFSAASGGKIIVQNGDTASFTANSIVNASTNASYTGTVHVFATYLDPTDPNLYKYMPGALRGIGTDGKETMLQSFGMLLVELQDDAGNKLQIASGQTATLSFAIPAPAQASAAATIPLWYFNDTTGRWIQQGSAARQGNNYVGTVSHFSFWNCDAPLGTVNFKVRLKDQHGNPLAYTLVNMVTNSWWGSAVGYTDSTGFVQGLVPKGESMVMQVMSECGNVLSGANIGPALNDQDLGTIVVTVNFSSLTLSGKVVDCFGNAVDSGLVSVTVDGLPYRANLTNGSFTLPVNRCFNTTVPVVLTGYNLATAESGSDTIMADAGNVDAGQIIACGTTVNQFLSFTTGGATYNLLGPTDDFSFYSNNYANKTTITAENSGSGNPSIYLIMEPVTGPGTYPVDSAYVSFNGLYNGAGLTCSISSYDAVNGFVIGTFSGSIAPQLGGTPQPISGSFKLIRNQ